MKKTGTIFGYIGQVASTIGFGSLLAVIFEYNYISVFGFGVMLALAIASTYVLNTSKKMEDM